MSFTIHPRLLKNSVSLISISQCHVLLKNEATIPWLQIVPEVADGVEDLHQLSPGRFEAVMQVIRQVSEFAERHFKPEKLNVACIGNQVRQMHIHVVARSPGDPVWPGVIWGAEYPRKPYEESAIEEIRNALHVSVSSSNEPS